jgi:transcriptional regulator with XRE-family HTH domain
MAAITQVAIRALDRMGGPRVILAAIPGGSRAVAEAAGVSPARVSQVLRSVPLSWEWAEILARLADCSEWEIYEQLGQRVTDAVTTAGHSQTNTESESL